MKKTLSLFLLLTVMFSSAQVNWMTLSQALENQKNSPKKILINFFSSDCQSCVVLENKTFNDPHISKMIKDHFYAVNFDIDSKEAIDFLGRNFAPDSKSTMHPFAKFMNINSTPTIVFFDEQAQPITNLMGSFSAKDAEPYFTMITTNHYKKIKNRQEWDNYQKKLKSK